MYRLIRYFLLLDKNNVSLIIVVIINKNDVRTIETNLKFTKTICLLSEV